MYIYGAHLHIFERVLKPRGEHAVTAQVKTGSCLGHLLAPRQQKQRNNSSLQVVPQEIIDLSLSTTLIVISLPLGGTSETSLIHTATKDLPQGA